MKDFDIRFEGEWFFSANYEANSKEEALEKALQNVCDEAYPFVLTILGQYVDDEKMDKPLDFDRLPGEWSEIYYGEPAIPPISWK